MLLANPYAPDDRVRQEALALQRGGYQVTILAWDRDCRKPEREQTDGLEIRRARIPAGYNESSRQLAKFPKLWRWFLQQMRDLQPHVVHCHDLDTLPAGAWYALRHRKVRLVFDAHECYSIMMAPHASAALSWCIRMTERLLTPRAHLLISPCAATGEYYRRDGARKVVVVGNWKKPEDFRFPQSVVDQKRSDLQVGDRLAVVYIGSLDADRVVLPLVEAVRQRPQVFLILGGNGDQASRLQEASAGADNIYFPGYVHPAQVPLLTVSADVVYYGFDPKHPFAQYNAPNKLYEALAAGKAMITADIGGELSEVLRATQSGLLLPQLDAVAIGNALDSLLDAGSRAQMQRRALAAGQTTYNWSTCEQRLVEAYQALGTEFPACGTGGAGYVSGKPPSGILQPRSMTVKDLPQVVRIHLQAFPRSALTALGETAVARYYEWQLTASHECLAIGVWEGSEMCGFCLCGRFGALVDFVRKDWRHLTKCVLAKPSLIANARIWQQLRFILGRLTRRRRRPRKTYGGSVNEPPGSARNFGILAIAVSPSAKRRGIGRSLMALAEQAAREWSAPQMRLTVEVDNAEAIQFYENLSWERELNLGTWKGQMIKRL